MTHLVEHLALGQVARADGIGGGVDVLFTYATVEGSPPEVVASLHEIGRRFADPPTERIVTERRILSAEEGDKYPHPASELMALIYGARGPGVTAFKEFGLRHAGPDDVRAHAQQWFSRANAALAMTAPLDGLDDLPLEAGLARPPEATPRLPLAPLPAEASLDTVRMALGAPMRGRYAATVLAGLVERRAWSTLRQEHGLAYDVECTTKRVGPEERLLYLTSDARADDVESAVAIAVEEIDRLAAGDFTDEDVAAARADVQRRVGGHPLTALMGAAVAELTRGEPCPPDEILAGLDAVTRDEVAASAAELSRNLVAVLPEGKRSGALPALDTSDERVDGRRYESVRAGGDPDADDLVVGRGRRVSDLRGGSRHHRQIRELRHRVPRGRRRPRTRRRARTARRR